MVAQCSVCHGVFDSKDGGSICEGPCHRTFCPNCELHRFGVDEKGFPQNTCLQCLGKPNTLDNRQKQRAALRVELWGKEAIIDLDNFLRQCGLLSDDQEIAVVDDLEGGQ